MSSFSWSIFQLPLYQLAGSGVQSDSRHFLRLVSFLGHSRPPSWGWMRICRCLEVQPRPHETEHGDHAPHSLTCKYFHKQSGIVWNVLAADEALVLLLVQFPIGLPLMWKTFNQVSVNEHAGKLSVLIEFWIISMYCTAHCMYRLLIVTSRQFLKAKIFSCDEIFSFECNFRMWMKISRVNEIFSCEWNFIVCVFYGGLLPD